MSTSIATDSPFRCPQCRSRIEGGACVEQGHPIATEHGIPVLLRDPSAVERLLAEAGASERADWYQAPQAEVFTGPYRHHVRKRRAYVDSVLSAYARERPERRVGLDLGCGDGAHLPWLAGHVTELYASDYNLLRLQRAAAHGVARLAVADVTDYAAADGAFDVVFFNHVIEHIPDDERALREIHRILAPGGIVVLGTPNEGAAFWRMAYRLQPESRRTTDHVHFYTADSLTRKCAAAGFNVREVKPIGWGLPHWEWDARVRGSKRVDDAFEMVGRRLLPSQASSLYVVLSR
jgi:2-polyprenyl-3-methyl-5-hydroxy-6-metoxy-1,4-benzoquinol methylase